MRPPPKAHPADERTRPPGRIVPRASLGYWLVLALVLLAALWLRVDDLIAWRHQPQRAFFEGQPLLISFDGYYYLSLARDLREGTYDAVDTLRGVPESPPRPMPPPLLSLLAAASPWSLNWTALLLPPLLGLTLAVPLILFGRLYGGRLMALVAVAMGLFPSYYVYRSHMGWFDTDCLNVTFLLLICYLFIRFGLTAGTRRYAYLASGFAVYLLFLLWWDQTPAIVTLICLSPLAIVLLLYYRPLGRERRVALCVGLAALAGIVAWQGPRIVVAPFQQALGQLDYISKQQGDAFPNVGVSVHEQKKMALADMIEMSTGHPLSFALGLVGLAALFWQQRRKAAALIVPFAIGALTFLFARRFLIFLTPFLAVGLGFAAQGLWQLRARWKPLRYATPLLIAVMVFIPFKESLSKIYWPKEAPPLIAGMDRLARTTEKTALVWAWWDHGYPLLYWADRATINDGSLHGGLRTVINAMPLVAEGAPLATRFMRFYAAHGPGGLEKLFAAMQSPARAMALVKEVLSAGPAAATSVLERAGLAPTQEWRAFFFPPATRDIYLFLDLRLAQTTYWWYWFGTWDPDKRDGIHPVFKWLPNGQRKGDTIEGDNFKVDLKQGTITIGQTAYPLAAVHIQDDQAWNEQRYANSKGLIFTYRAPTRSGALMDRTFADSLFSQLYIYQKANPDFFSLHAENYPYYQIWRVQAENPAGLDGP